MRMKYRLLFTALFPALVTGCSFYDVAALSADMALELFTDVNDDKDRDDPGAIHFRDPETSRCIVLEKDKRKTEHRLTQQLETIEHGKDFVILPTGEKYPVNRHAAGSDPELGPTAACLARQSD